MYLIYENQDEVHFFASILNAIVGITSHYCVILKMVILHNTIKTIQNEVTIKTIQKTTVTT